MKEILKRVATEIRTWGYRGSGQTYRRLDGDLVFVINFQKSRWGDRFYVNLGAQPTAIPNEAEQAPNTKNLREHECIFRRRVGRDWDQRLAASDFDALLVALDETRRTFEEKVRQMRQLSREGRAQELFDGRFFTSTEARAALVLARLLAADGHADGARRLANHVLSIAGEAGLLDAAAKRLLTSLVDRDR
jgi:uncharacterized protein DUF4304